MGRGGWMSSPQACGSVRGQECRGCSLIHPGAGVCRGLGSVWLTPILHYLWLRRRGWVRARCVCMCVCALGAVSAMTEGWGGGGGVSLGGRGNVRVNSVWVHQGWGTGRRDDLRYSDWSSNRPTTASAVISHRQQLEMIWGDLFILYFSLVKVMGWWGQGVRKADDS